VSCWAVEKKVQGRGRPGDELYGVREFAFCDEIFEGGQRWAHGADMCVDLRQLLHNDLLHMTPFFPTKVEHRGRGPQGLVVPCPCLKDGM
jgi:hypothetical protein